MNTSDDETCAGCGALEIHHNDGTCPVQPDGEGKAPISYRSSVTTPKRGRGRPPGSLKRTLEERTNEFVKVQAFKTAKRQITNVLAREGVKVAKDIGEVARQKYTRLPNRPDCPTRTATEIKDAALKLLNQQLWNLEGQAQTEGLTEDEEARLLKVLSGVNAALPKAAEEPGIDKLSAEEIKRRLGK